MGLSQSQQPKAKRRGGDEEQPEFGDVSKHERNFRPHVASADTTDRTPPGEPRRDHSALPVFNDPSLLVGSTVGEAFLLSICEEKGSRTSAEGDNP